MLTFKEPKELKTQSENQKEPLFNNMPIATLIIVIICIAIEFVRSFEANNVPFAWVIDSALIPARYYYYRDMGNLGFAALWPFVGYQFLHAGWFHVLMNCGMMLQAGPIAEIGLIKNANMINYREIKTTNEGRYFVARGAFWFSIFFIMCGIGSAIGFMWFNNEPNVTLMGASGAISGVFAGFLWAAFKSAKRGTQMLKLLASSAFFFLFINVGGAALARFTNFIPIAWDAHLFGFLTGLMVYPFIYKLVRL
jgi:membrane associated rhomboid family serine protease